MGKIDALIMVMMVGGLVTSPVISATISLDSSQIGIFTGGSFSTGSGVDIKGTIGVIGNSWVGKNSNLQGMFYTNGTFGTGQHVNLTGNVYAGGDVYLGSQSSVGSLQGLKNVGLDQKVQVNGNLLAGQTVNLGKDSAVHGDVKYGTEYWIGKKATVDGNISKDNSGLDTWKFNSPTAPSSWLTDSDDIYYGAHSEQYLAPGTYGSLSADDGTILHLTAGTYTFSQMWLGPSTQLIVDSSNGDVRFNIAGDLSTGTSVLLGQSGLHGALEFNAKGNIYLGAQNIAYAGFNGYGSSLGIDKNSQIYGNMYSLGDVWLGQNVMVDASVMHGVPEPATLIFLFLGAVGIFRRTR